jgi:hypothetical protein
MLMAGMRSLSSGRIGATRLALPAIYVFSAVIASEAKQSSLSCVKILDCFVALAPRNDGVYFSLSLLANVRENSLDTIFTPTTDLPVVPICRS